jgi:hypothetical protein
VKRRLATLPLETAVVAAVIPKPQPDEDCGNDHAVKYNGGGKLEHAGKSLRGRSGRDKTKKRAEVSFGALG